MPTRTLGIFVLRGERACFRWSRPAQWTLLGPLSSPAAQCPYPTSSASLTLRSDRLLRNGACWRSTSLALPAPRRLDGLAQGAGNLGAAGTPRHFHLQIGQLERGSRRCGGRDQPIE